MTDLILVGITIIAFIATNIDDLFVLMFFFSKSSYKNSHIVIGQYIGVTGLILISSLGFFFNLIIPSSLISLLGIFPIIIGIKELIKLKKNKKNTDEIGEKIEFKKSSIMEVAFVSFSNGGDNIGIYLPLFASINYYQIPSVIITFLVMVSIWCLLSHSLVNHRLLNDKIKKYGHIIFPFVLIALGLFILLK
jgi:cadmium resistance protein CadD (predicted permease)